MLAALVERPGEVLTRDEFRRRLWPDEVFVDFDNVLNTAVAKLREALGDSADHPRFIETLPKHGYRSLAPVSEPVPVDRPPARRPRLLVLPFLNASGDPAQDYFSDAMTDEIITAFAAFAPDELAVMLYLDRQYARAVEQGRVMVEIEPANYAGYWIVGAYAPAIGLFDESIAAYRKAVELSGGSMLILGWFGLALGQSGNTGEARAVLEQLHEAAGRQMYVPPSAFAWTYLGLGDIDNPFVWLDRAVDGRDRMIVPIQFYPFFDELRGDPRYAELLRKMKMTPAVTEKRRRDAS